MSRPLNIYFASDFHLGSAIDVGGHIREMKVVRWLDSVATDATHIFLLGDVFDFWFEYKHVVPKGHVRLLGKLAELSDKGIEIHMFTGNHDVWMFDYFPSEMGIQVHKAPITQQWDGKVFFIGHGDGLGPGDHGYKFIKGVFHNRMAQRLFAFLHPWIGVNLARFFSRKSRESTGEKDSVYLGDDNEYLVQFCREYVLKNHVDVFIFGHRHMMLDLKVGAHSRYVNLGEWFSGFHFAHFNGIDLKVHRFES